jgi:nucleoside-diphosphate-sugar epimerase
MNNHLSCPTTQAELEALLASASPALCADLQRVPGSILILGAAGKMGPSLARLARRAAPDREIIAVSRFSQDDLPRAFEAEGIQPIRCDLMECGALERLPDAPNIVYMAGMKFGATGNEALTWAMNTWLPAVVCERWPASRIVAFSTGNVYPLSDPASGGPSETSPTGPIGEYAQSCLGRERMFEFFSRRDRIPMAIIRLNYANDLRYGVLVDIARQVLEGRPVNLEMGHVNLIWQGDANSQALRALAHCQSLPHVINVTGHETVSVRWLAQCFGRIFDREPVLEGCEQPTALLSDAAHAQELFGPVTVPLDMMIDWTARWLSAGGPTLNKPTHFQTRDGRF